MSDPLIGAFAIIALFVLVLGGVHIAFSLMAIALIGMYLLSENLELTALLASNAAFGGVRQYVFVVIPLFILMGAFMSNSAAAHHLFAAAQIGLRRMIGGLGIATVFANALFAAVTGVSAASAAIFSRIAVPEMLKRGYDLRLAVGAVAGSSVLGILIPPSLLLILYGVIGQVSIGRLFLAGIIPGLLLAVFYVVLIVVLGYTRPEWVGKVARESRRRRAEVSASVGGSRSSELAIGDGPNSHFVAEVSAVSRNPAARIMATVPVLFLFAAVIGGIWLGWYTPTEASAIGALGALIIAVGYGMRKDRMIESFRETAASIGAIMLLLIAAQMYSKMLSRSGLIFELGGWLQSINLGPYVVIALFVVVLLLMGSILDSSSIVLIMVPVMVPVALMLELDPIWFGIVMIIAIEIGVLTPPFGMVPYVMSAVLKPRVSVGKIFIGASPFVFCNLLLLVLVVIFPELATWLPNQA
ncbi:TRAP transporter large permease [Aeromicrobium phragmitis]|uniref:TRAP transporter large permease n=1 Tax=Aeromicrobium phragmitis TaxID=2478914 RepID=A0A3L8PKE4_9ACTN|nr:TRAP transporter large permease [Aeromicrobium phragmitis]RLV55664.1 TRAP transporter large permease [Aeromicrobium phragmitis]